MIFALVGLAAGHPDQVGPTVLAAVGHVLHPVPPRAGSRWRPILTVALLLLFTVISVRLDVMLSFQGNDLFTALQEQDQPTFWRLDPASSASS